MLDLYVISVLFSWITNRFIAYSASQELQKEGYVYRRDPSTIANKGEHYFDLACKMLIPFYNVFNALKCIFNPKEAKAERKSYLRNSGRIYKPQQQVVLTPDGRYMTKEQILREQRLQKQTKKNTNSYSKQAEIEKQKRIALNNMTTNSYKKGKTYKK